MCLGETEPTLKRSRDHHAHTWQTGKDWGKERSFRKHYDRHDVLKRAEEVQSLPIGRQKPPEVETINIMAL